MSLLSDAELSQMRTVTAEALPGTAVIQTQTGGDDAGGGGGSATWAAAGTVDCRIGPMSGTERERGERIASEAEFIITLPHSATITTNQRIVSGGGTFNVAAIRDRSWDLTTRVEAIKEV